MADQVEETSWLTEALQETTLQCSDRACPVTVISSRVQTNDTFGAHYGSDMFRLHAEVRLGSSARLEQLPLVVKCHPRGGEQEQIFADSDVFNKETSVYTKVLPLLYEQLANAERGKYDHFSAKCLHHGKQPLPYLVLEDLSPLGFRLVDKSHGLDLAHSTVVIKTLARFHAASIAVDEKDPAFKDSYKKGLFHLDIRDYFEGFVKRAIRFVAEETRKWPGEYHDYPERLTKLSEEIYDRIIALTRYKKGRLNAFLHGDLWINNMMFNYVDGEVSEVRFVDFQISFFSSPAIDLQYLFHTSLSERVYAEHLEDLLLAYHETLSRTLDALGCGRRKVSLEQLREDVEEHALYGLHSAVTILPVVLADKDAPFDAELNLREPHADSSANSHIFGTSAYIQAMKRLLPIFGKKGIF